MFDIGFSELLVIGVVALLVIGPERLPKVARTAGILFGRFQRYVANVKSDIQREMDASELAKLKTEVQDAARSFEQSVNEEVRTVESGARELEQSLKSAADATTSPSADVTDSSATAALPASSTDVAPTTLPGDPVPAASQQKMIG